MTKRTKRKTDVLVVLSLIVFLLIQVSPVMAAEDIEINETNFPDAQFIEFVKTYDTSGDGTLQQSELNAVTEMDCTDKSISDLTGIEHFTELTVLRCRDNQLTSLDVSQNTKLIELSCPNNQLTALNVNGLSELEIYIAGTTN